MSRAPACSLVVRRGLEFFALPADSGVGLMKRRTFATVSVLDISKLRPAFGIDGLTFFDTEDNGRLAAQQMMGNGGICTTVHPAV